MGENSIVLLQYLLLECQDDRTVREHAGATAAGDEREAWMKRRVEDGTQMMGNIDYVIQFYTLLNVIIQWMY